MVVFRSMKIYYPLLYLTIAHHGVYHHNTVNIITIHDHYDITSMADDEQKDDDWTLRAKSLALGRGGQLEKSREDRYSQGVTQREIVRYILEFDKGVDEPRIRDHLKETLLIRAMRNIKTHLERLEKEGIIQKVQTKGGPNVWTLAYDTTQITKYHPSWIGYDAVSGFLVHEFFNRWDNAGFLGYHPLIEVFNAKGTQKFIEKKDWTKLVTDYISVNRGINPPHDRKLEIQGLFKEAISISPTLFREMFTPKFETHLVASLLFESLEKKRPESEEDSWHLERDSFLMLLLAPLLIDAVKHPTQKPKISEFIWGALDSYREAGDDKNILHDKYRQSAAAFVAFEEIINERELFLG